MVRAKMMTVVRWYAQDEVNQEESEQNEVDGMKKGADSQVRCWSYINIIGLIRFRMQITACSSC